MENITLNMNLCKNSLKLDKKMIQVSFLNFIIIMTILYYCHYCDIYNGKLFQYEGQAVKLLQNKIVFYY